MRQVAKIEPLPLPDVRRPAKLTSLPLWVEERLAGLKKEHQPDATGKHREVSVLPKDLMLTEVQTRLIGRHIAALADLQAMTPENNENYCQPTLIAVTKMIMTLGGRETGELAASAKGDAYMAALEDVAFWAVEEAARRWYRGECGEGHDYRWMPAPATLRELAQNEEFRVRGVGSRLQRLLDAKQPRNFSPEHEAAMKAKLRGLGLEIGATA